jgi:hypothetical protein
VDRHLDCDEIVRAKPSFEAWQVKRFPLIEKRLSRRDCLAWLRRHDYPDPPKSSVHRLPVSQTTQYGAIDARTGCRLHGQDAVEVDYALRTGLQGHSRRGIPASILRAARRVRSIDRR